MNKNLFLKTVLDKVYGQKLEKLSKVRQDQKGLDIYY